MFPYVLPDSSAAHGAKTVCNARPGLLVHFCIDVLFIGPQLQPRTHLFLHKKPRRRNKTLFQNSHHRTLQLDLRTLLEPLGVLIIIFLGLADFPGYNVNSAVSMSWKCFEKHHLSPKVAQQSPEMCIFNCFSRCGEKQSNLYSLILFF